MLDSFMIYLFLRNPATKQRPVSQKKKKNAEVHVCLECIPRVHAPLENLSTSDKVCNSQQRKRRTIKSNLKNFYLL